MSNLTQVAISARKAIRYGIYFIIFIIVGKIVLDATVGLYKRLFPAPPPPPTVKFGTLSKIPFPANDLGKDLSYVLETPTGSLPTDIPIQAKVYFMPKISSNLLALDVAKEKAASLNFDGDFEQVSETVYKFKNPSYPTALQMNIITGVFSISYDLTSDRSPLDSKPPVAEIAASEFRSSLSSANILPGDLSGPTSHEFFKLSDAQFVNAISLSEADVVKVNLFRKAFDELPSLTANPNEANVWAIISGAGNREQKIIASEYHYFPVDESQFSTYPVKTPQEAFAELQAGGAFIANKGINNEKSLKIRRVYIAYFDPEEPTDFYQPIYVFEGDNGFTAYLPAVTADYYGE